MKFGSCNLFVAYGFVEVGPVIVAYVRGFGERHVFFFLLYLEANGEMNIRLSLLQKRWL